MCVEASRWPRYNLYVEDIIKAKYARSRRRLFLLDYDGTLVGYKAIPSEAVPTPDVLAMLKRLSEDPKNYVVVISGRAHETLDEWLGTLPLAFAAEHGFFVKEKDGDWRMVYKQSSDWKDIIHPVMEAARKELPGAIVEEKVSSLVWHYRNANLQQALPIMSRLEMQLQLLVKSQNLLLYPGHMVLEVKVSSVNKGIAAKHWLGQKEWDFVLGAGDDRTDEDLFAALPDNGFSIKIGPGESRAKFVFSGPQTFVNFLDTLVE